MAFPNRRTPIFCDRGIDYCGRSLCILLPNERRKEATDIVLVDHEVNEITMIVYLPELPQYFQPVFPLCESFLLENGTKLTETISDRVVRGAASCAVLLHMFFNASQASPHTHKQYHRPRTRGGFVGSVKRLNASSNRHCAVVSICGV
jgi:hypothetical protein